MLCRGIGNLYLHTDYVHEQMKNIAPGMSRFKAASISGFFLNHKTVEGNPVYPRQMQVEKYVVARWFI